MQGEVDELVAHKMIEEKVDLMNGQFGYVLKVGEKFWATSENGKVVISVPNDVAANWSKSEDLSIDHFLELPNGEKLRLLIEKDLACLTDRPHEDESDAFPNPKKNC